MVASILDIVTLAVILLIAIWLHEYSHAYVSYKLWDPTPKLQWRLTTNPLKHIDIIWFLMIFLIWFWWWKPVQINPSYYKNPLKWELLVALAWPAMNLVLAIAWIFLLIFSSNIIGLDFQNIKIIVDEVRLTWSVIWSYFLLRFFILFSMLNIGLAIFNMIPVAPLDGFSIIKMVFPKFANMIRPYTQYITLWFLILLFSRWPFSSFLSWTREILFRWIFTFFSSIFY